MTIYIKGDKWEKAETPPLKGVWNKAQKYKQRHISWSSYFSTENIFILVNHGGRLNTEISSKCYSSSFEQILGCSQSPLVNEGAEYRSLTHSILINWLSWPHHISFIVGFYFIHWIPKKKQLYILFSIFGGTYACSRTPWLISQIKFWFARK